MKSLLLLSMLLILPATKDTLVLIIGPTTRVVVPYELIFNKNCFYKIGLDNINIPIAEELAREHGPVEISDWPLLAELLLFDWDPIKARM